MLGTQYAVYVGSIIRHMLKPGVEWNHGVE